MLHITSLHTHYTTPHHPALFLTTPNHAVTHHTTSHHSHNSTSSHLFPHHSTTQLQSTPHQGHTTPFSAFFTLHQSCTHYTIKPQQTTPTTSSCILSHTSTRYANEQRRSRHYPTPLNQQYNILPRSICMRERFLFVPHRFNFPPWWPSPLKMALGTKLPTVYLDVVHHVTLQRTASQRTRRTKPMLDHVRPGHSVRR